MMRVVVILEVIDVSLLMLLAHQSEMEEKRIEEFTETADTQVCSFE